MCKVTDENLLPGLKFIKGEGIMPTHNDVVKEFGIILGV